MGCRKPSCCPCHSCLPPSLGDASAEMARLRACATQGAGGSCRLGVDDEVEPVGACVARHVGGGVVLGVGGAADQTHLRWGFFFRPDRVPLPYLPFPSMWVYT